MKNEYYIIFNILQKFNSREDLMYDHIILKSKILKLKSEIKAYLPKNQRQNLKEFEKLIFKSYESEKLQLIKFVIDYFEL